MLNRRMFLFDMRIYTHIYYYDIICGRETTLHDQTKGKNESEKEEENGCDAIDETEQEDDSDELNNIMKESGVPEKNKIV
jgi:hypothetical protein